MKTKHSAALLLCAVLAVVIALFGSLTVLAVDADGDGIDDDPQQTVADVTVEPETEPEVQPPTEAQTEYVEPKTESVTEYYEPETQAPAPVTDYVEQKTQPPNNQVADEEPNNEETTTEFQAPTLAKTISNKNYSTSNTAGIAAWVCVIIGSLVLFIVLISTKISGFKDKSRRAQNGYYEHG